MTQSIKDALVAISDGPGWNGNDQAFGESLTRIARGDRPLSGTQAVAAYRMIQKYDRQLRSLGVDLAKVERPPGVGDDAKPSSSARSASVNRNAIRIEADTRIRAFTPFKYKDLCKSIPGAKWDPDAKCWSWEATPYKALDIRDAFTAVKVEFGDGFDALLNQGLEMRNASEMKTIDESEVPDIPVHAEPAPWTHQKRAFHFARDKPGAMLAMDMGTGKSRGGVDQLENNGARRVLILAPKSATQVWPKQFRLWGTRPWRVIVNSGNSVRQRVEAAEYALSQATDEQPIAVAFNYEVISREPFKSWARDFPWDYVIFDECHRLKGGGVWSRWAAQLCASLRANEEGLGRRLGLTGTPMPSGPTDVFWQFRAIEPDVFGASYKSFERRYCIMGGYENREVLGYQRQDELHERFYSIAYRVEADDVLDLPGTLPDVSLAFDLDREARKVYDTLRDEMYAEFGDGEITADNVLVKLLRLQQLTGGALKTDEGTVREVHTGKASLLEERLFDLPADEPVVVFCRFIHDLDSVRTVTEKLGRRYGEISGRRRDLTQDATMPEGIDILAVQIQSGGEGIDLTRARYGIYYSLGFSLGQYLQSRRRLDRPGQTRPVSFTHLVASGTIDEQVYAALEQRKEVVDSILEEGF